MGSEPQGGDQTASGGHTSSFGLGVRDDPALPHSDPVFAKHAQWPRTASPEERLGINLRVDWMIGHRAYEEVFHKATRY